MSRYALGLALALTTFATTTHADLILTWGPVSGALTPGNTVSATLYLGDTDGLANLNPILDENGLLNMPVLVSRTAGLSEIGSVSIPSHFVDASPSVSATSADLDLFDDNLDIAPNSPLVPGLGLEIVTLDFVLGGEGDVSTFSVGGVAAVAIFTNDSNALSTLGYGDVSGQTLTLTVIPEPASIALAVLAGAVALSGRRR